MWLDRLLATDEGASGSRRRSRALAVRARASSTTSCASATPPVRERLPSRCPTSSRCARRARGGARGALGRDDDGAPLGVRRVRSGDRSGGLGGARRDPGPGDPGHLARRPRRREGRRGRGAARARSSSHRRSWAVPRSTRCGGRWRRRSRSSAGSATGRRPPRRLVVDRPDHAGGPREAARGGLRAARAARGGRADARPAAVEGVPLPVLRLDRDAAREHLRPDPVPLAALLRLPAASRSSSSRRSSSPAFLLGLLRGRRRLRGAGSRRRRGSARSRRRC